MNTYKVFFDNIDDVVFAHKNKAYGAYALRRNYDSNMLKGIFIAPVVILLLFLLLKGNTKSGVADVIYKTIDLTPWVYEIPPAGAVAPAPRPLSPKAVMPIAKSETPTRVVTDEIEIKVVKPDQMMTTSTNTGSDVVSGSSDETNTVVGNGSEGSTVDLAGNGTGISTETESNTIHRWVQEMPQFPNGNEALMKFIKDHMNYPKVAIEASAEGTVILQFIVLENGEIGSVKVVRGMGFGCDEEASRVVNMMPRWKPGIHNGKAVKVKFNLPINFKIHR